MQIGYKDTILLHLSYIDPVRTHLVDPINNLFLGTDKNMGKLWLNNALLTNTKVKGIERKLKKVNISSDSGRLPHRIGSKWSKFTSGEQFKVFETLISTDLEVDKCSLVPDSIHAPLQDCTDTSC